MVETVTSGVSVLPVVGSDLLSVAAGGTDQLLPLGSNFNYENNCPQKIEWVQKVGPTENRWDGHLILNIICWFCKWLNTQKWDPRNGLWEMSGHYKWKLCTGTVPRSIQYPGGDSEMSDGPGIRGLRETTGSVDRNGQYDDDADWFNGNPNRAGGSVATETDATVAQYCSYIRGILTKNWALSNRPAVEVSVLGYPSRLVQNTDNKVTAWIRLSCVWFYKCQAGRIVMSSSKFMPVVTRPRTIEGVPSHPSESFLKRVSDSHLDKLYDLPENIQDVMGLQALRPSAAVCKVMTIPNSNCVRIVTPDEHVSTGFHEILVYDMGQEEWPQVPLSEIGCLRLDWPKDLFAFVGRYQLELDEMRKVCRDRFGPAASGMCLTCEKYIQVNLGKHMALYHLDLAQLWRCPVDWCPVWKGTSQDCVDHMRRAHNTPVSVKAGNLARWFPPWTVTREQWHSMSRPSVSGIAIDTSLFSRIGTPLFHRYLFTFLKESDAESICRSHRRWAKEIAASMSKKTSSSKEAPVDTTLSRRSVERTAISKETGREAGPSLIPTAGGRPRSSASSIYRRSVEEDTAQALMDLSLPRFAKLDDGVIPKTEPWPVTENSPASPVSAEDGNRTCTPSPCMDLDDISSDSLGSEASPHDFRVTLFYDSEDSDTPVGSIVFSSDEDAPLNFGQKDRRKVRKRDPRPMNQPRPTDVPAYEPTPRERPVDVPGYEPTPRERPVDVPAYVPTPRERPVDVPAYEPTPREGPADGSAYEPTLRGRPVDDPMSEPTPKKRPVDPKNVPLIYLPPPPADLPEWSDSEVMPLIIIENSSAVEKPRTTDGLLPVGSEILLPQSPEVTSFEDQEALSAPLSPNRVRKGHSQDMPAEGSIFDVSPDVPGFNMRPAGGGVQPTAITQPSPSNYVGFNNPFFGAPIAFAQCHNTSGMGTTTTVPIYSIPKDSNIGIDQSAVPTVFASGVSPDSIP